MDTQTKRLLVSTTLDTCGSESLIPSQPLGKEGRKSGKGELHCDGRTYISTCKCKFPKIFIWINPFCWIYVSWCFVLWINESFIPSVPKYSILIPYRTEEMYKTNIKKLIVNSHEWKRKKCQIRLCLSNRITKIIAPQLLIFKLVDNWDFSQIPPLVRWFEQNKFRNSIKSGTWTQVLLLTLENCVIFARYGFTIINHTPLIIVHAHNKGCCWAHISCITLIEHTMIRAKAANKC